MKKKVCPLACAVLCLAAYAGSACASVTINGKGLSNIDDIVLETTGSRVVHQESVLKVLKASDGNLRFYAVRGSGTGGSVSLPESGAQYLNADGGKTNTGLHPAVGTKRNSDGSLVIMVPAATDSGVTANFYRVSLDANSNVTQTRIVSKSVATGSNLYVTDAAGGLFPYGKDGEEVFVIAYFSADGNKRPGFKQSFTSYVAFVDASGKVQTQRVGTMNGCFPSIRVATGDFDHDDWAREIAIMRDGSGHDYYMQMLNVTSSLGMEERYHTSLGTRDDDADNIDGCDVVAGDFDGDGATDLAAVYADKIKYDGYPAVTTFKWNGSGFDTKYRADEDEDLRMGSTYWTRSSFVPHFGLIAEAGDLDGDGKDELVFLTPSYMTGDKTIGEGGTVLVSVWGMDGSLSPSRKFWRSAYLSIYGYGGVSGTDMAECSYLPRSISLALVPVGDKQSDGAFTRRVFISKSQGDDEVQKASNYGAGDYVGYLTPQISGGSVTGLADIVRHSGGGAGRALGLLPGDFYCQTVELGEPDHMVFEDERSYAAEIQTPPYHVDYVQVPFAVNGSIPAKPSVLNMSYMGSNVVYSKSQTDSEKSDVSFKTTSTLDWGASANATVPLIGTTLSGGYKDTATSVQNATSSSEAKTTLTLTDATDATDIAMLYKTDRHVWRYPVISAAPGRPEGSNGDAFMTFSLCDTPTTAHGAIGQSSQFDDYNPIHEEGNLFSYPTKIEDIPCYSQRQYDLTAEQQKTTGGNTTIDLAVSETHADTNGTTTTSKKVVNGSASVSIPIPKVLNIGASATASYANELTDTTTFTKSYLSSEKFTVNLKNGALGFGSEKVAHDIKTQLYADAAGVMKVGFAVDLKSTAGDTAEVWQEGGMYYGKSDPALVLPAKYTRFTSVVDNVTRVVWSANTNRKSAIQLRGIWFRDENDKVVSPALVRGKKYTIEVPVYNASFKAPAQDVKIAMQLRTLGATASEDKVVVGDAGSRTFSIGGWTKDTESNKATVTFDWTVPSSVEKGNYHLYFVLDPENVIDELHEDWDAAKDPGGNNVGCYPVAILETEPAAYTTDAGVSVASVAEDDFRMLLREPGTEDGEWISLAQFRDELSRMDEDFRAHAKIIYSGADTLTNMYLDVVRVDPDGSEVRVASRVVPALFPNTEYEVSFMVSPEKASAGTFGASLSGSGTNLRWGKAEGGNGSGSSSGGCRTGTANSLVLLLAATFPALMKRKAK